MLLSCNHLANNSNDKDSSNNEKTSSNSEIVSNSSDISSNKSEDTSDNVIDVDFSQLSFTAFGDSITFGYDLTINNRVETPYPTAVSNILNLKSFENLGINGATVASNDLGLACITDIITNYTKNADIIGILGGVNDYNRSLPLGDINDNDKSTIYGALHVSMKYLTTNYKDSFVFYMTPFKEYFHGNL